MSWAKFDDRYDDSLKIREVWRMQPAAVGLHAMSITYASRHETDGEIPHAWLLDKIPNARQRDRALKALVDCRLFVPIAGGFQVVNYLEFNPSRAELEARRARDAERKARGRASQSKRSPSGLHAESDGPVPSRPVPSNNHNQSGSTPEVVGSANVEPFRRRVS